MTNPPASTGERPTPNHVAIVAMGASAHGYLQLASSQGGRHTVADEIWAINATASILHHDRAFIMQDIKYNITREAREGKKVAQGILDWLPNHPGPVYSSKAYPEWPALVEFPLRDVLQAVGGLPYLNNSVAHAIGFAMMIGVQELSLYGCDFTYPDLHVAESGRGCVEYLLGIACVKGMKLNMPSTTTLMDANVPDDRRIYGYHEPVHVSTSPAGQIVVAFGEMPTASASESSAPAAAPAPAVSPEPAAPES